MTKARDLANIISGGFTADDIPSLDASKITTGTFADARIAASNVSQHATSFDDNKIVNDISTLALRQASDQNKSAYNTNSQFVDVFQDATGIDTTTNTTRNASEYVSSSSQVFQSSNIKFTGSGYIGTAINAIRPTDNTNWTCEGWIYPTNLNKTYLGVFGSGLDFYGVNLSARESQDASYLFVGNGGWTLSRNLGSLSSLGIVQDNWVHFAVTKSSTTFKSYWNGVLRDTSTAGISENSSNFFFGISQLTARTFEGYMTGLRVSNSVRYTSNFTPSTTPYSSDANTLLLINSNTTNGSTTFTDSSSNNYSINSIGSGMEHSTAVASPLFTGTFNTNGNFTGTTITAPSSVSSMGAIITYQDASGTNALNTDIVLQLSADGGSNYSTATLTALPNFATGIKMAKVNDLAVTAGTQLKYKLNFANQASGSKEARIRGVALQY